MKKLIVILILLSTIALSGQTIMNADSTLYRIERLNYAGNTGSTGALLLHGDSVRINLMGSHVLTDSISHMTNIYSLITPAPDSVSILAPGAYAAQILPKYLLYVGSADSIEIVGYRILETVGTLP